MERKQNNNKMRKQGKSEDINKVVKYKYFKKATY